MDSDKTVLASFLEDILFQREEFNVLKTAINQLSMNEIEAKDVRKLIIDSKLRVLTELLNFIPNEINRGLQYSQLNDFVEKRETQNTSYLEELQEKDAFIAEVMQRLERINEAISQKGPVKKSESNVIQPQKVLIPPRPIEKKDIKEPLTPAFSEQKQKIVQYLVEEYKKQASDALQAYQNNQFDAFLRERSFSIDKYISLMYYIHFEQNLDKEQELKYNVVIKQLQEKTKKNLGLIKGLTKWKSVRDGIVHHGNLVDKYTADEAKIFFDKCEKKLKEISK